MKEREDGWLYLAYFDTVDQLPFLTHCVMDELPPGVKLGHTLNERASFVGYFLKLRSFSPGEQFFSPMLIGRLALLDRVNIVPPKPVTERGRALARDRIDIGIDKDGHVSIDDREIDPKVIALDTMIKYHADMARLNAKHEGQALKDGAALPARVVLRAHREVPFATISPILTTCQKHALASFSFQAQGVEGKPARFKAPARPDKGTGIATTFRTVPISFRPLAGDSSVLVTLGENEPTDWASAQREIKEVLQDPELPFDQVLLGFDPAIKFGFVVEVIDLLAGIPIRNVSFQLAKPDNKGGAP